MVCEHCGFFCCEHAVFFCCEMRFFFVASVFVVVVVVFVFVTSRSLPDAPALRAANVGVAMGKSGSDLARKTAHIVLTDDNFVSIVAAVREGRRIIHSIKKFLVMALTANIGMAILLMIGLAFRDAAGLVVFAQTALEILCLNMIFETVLVLGIVTEPPVQDVMSFPPYRSKYVLTADVLLDLTVYAVIYGGCAVGVFCATLYGAYGGAIGTSCNSTLGVGCQSVLAARGATFLTQALMLIFAAYNARDPYDAVWNGWLNRHWNFVLLVGSLVVALLAIIFIYVPVLNTTVFQHAPITFELGFVVAGVAAFMLLSTIWKLLVKRIFFSPPVFVAQPIDTALVDSATKLQEE